MKASTASAPAGARVTLRDLVGQRAGRMTKTFFTYHRGVAAAMVPELGALPRSLTPWAR